MRRGTQSYFGFKPKHPNRKLRQQNPGPLTRYLPFFLVFHVAYDTLNILKCAWRCTKTYAEEERSRVPLLHTNCKKKKTPRCGGALQMSNLVSFRNRPVPLAVIMVPRTHGQSGHVSTSGGGWYTWPTDRCSNRERWQTRLQDLNCRTRTRKTGK